MLMGVPVVGAWAAMALAAKGGAADSLALDSPEIGEVVSWDETQKTKGRVRYFGNRGMYEEYAADNQWAKRVTQTNYVAVQGPPGRVRWMRVSIWRPGTDE